MTLSSPLLRAAALVVVLVLGAVSVTGFYTIRNDLRQLDGIGRDNMLWSSVQMEIELLRFQRSLALYATDPTEAAREKALERLDILWSRLNLVGAGRVGAQMRALDEGHGALSAIRTYLTRIDPFLLALDPSDAVFIPGILQELGELQSSMRQFSQRVVRADTAAASYVRERLQAGAFITAAITIGTLLIGLITFFLIIRDNARQREVAAMNLRQAEAAEAASRAKSRFLTMMSHELRNPLNGILGPLALVGQSEIGERQFKLIERAQQSGRMMLRMLRGLLDYGDIQDERMMLREEVFRPKHLADEVRAALADTCGPATSRARVVVEDGVPDMLWGDSDRLAQIFVYLAEYVLDPECGVEVAVRFSHDGQHLIGAIEFADPQERLAWKLDLLTGLGDEARRTFASDALGPLIARGLLRAARGLLTLEGENGRWVIRVTIPARKVVFDKIVVRIETRSAALATLYRAALKSDRVGFAERSDEEVPDVVLVDSTSAGEQSLMRGLRARFPNAVFVSLGTSVVPGVFDEVVDAPADLARLRESVLGRLAS